MKLMFWTGFWVFLIDQITKYYVVHWLGLINEADGRIEVWPPFLEFRMAWNRGVNFGLFADYDMRWVLIGVAFAITGGVIWWLNRIGGTKWVYISGGFLIGGAMGNVIDRFFYGAVADFLNMSCCGINNPYAFNVADISIFIGAIGLAFLADDKKKAA
ncbi:MAG: signal peptidase II [Yoonia sp.]|uniref:signal peptidase II n=1 Tax=Yoonia sp. TaxID=2212373 RepID=UPI002740046E|nr:signal peptidase II [Yoonia sp.]MDP5086400.1 signal peptidase II [Yoonia sp.]MDP5362931.1 signal peptidase II [Paracoccaceae bacterium]